MVVRSGVATKALRTGRNADEGQRADDGANIPSCLPGLCKFSPFTAEWETYRQLSGTM